MKKQASKPKLSKLQKSKNDENSRYWRNRADHQWMLAIRNRWGHKCAVCNATENCQAHHINPRELTELRHNEENGILLCVRHHKYGFGVGEKLSAHKSSFAFVNWLIENSKEQFEISKKHLELIGKIGYNYKNSYEKLLKYNEPHNEQ